MPQAVGSLLLARISTLLEEFLSPDLATTVLAERLADQEWDGTSAEMSQSLLRSLREDLSRFVEAIAGPVMSTRFDRIYDRDIMPRLSSVIVYSME